MGLEVDFVCQFIEFVFHGKLGIVGSIGVGAAHEMEKDVKSTGQNEGDPDFLGNCEHRLRSWSWSWSCVVLERHGTER